MATTKTLTIQVLGWEKYNPRKDIKHPTWFALSNRILEDQDLFSLTDSEFRAYIYILSLASQKASPTVTVSLERAKFVAKVSEAAISGMVEKLSPFGILAYAVDQSPVRERTDTYAVQHGSVRDRQTDKTDITDKTERESKSAGADRLPPLAEIWNENCGTLAKVRNSNAARDRKADARLKETSPEDWTETVRKIAQSPFCNGRNERGWKATFDWLLQPETRLKVQEGKYDDRSNGIRGGEETTEQRHARLLAEHEAWKKREAEIYGEGA